MPHRAARPPASTWIAAAITIAALTVAAGASPARRASAQTPGAPKLEIALFAPYIVVRTETPGRPAVRLVAADGAVKIVVSAAGDRPADGRWVVPLRTPAMEPAEYITADPGDTVTVEVDGRTTSVVVPRITADVDVDGDVVSGTVPPTLGVYVVVTRDETLYGPMQPAPSVVVPASDGNYRAELAGTMDIAPGTWGYAAFTDTAQNLFALAFAPPFVNVSPARFTAIVRANADARPEVAVVDDLGTEIARSGPPIPVAAGLFVVVLLRGGRPENGAFQPQPGDRVALIVDGRTVVEETLPDVTAVIDPDARRVAGRAPAGARVVVTARSSEAATDTAGRAVAGADGRYDIAFPALPFAADAVAFALAWSGGGTAYEVPGRVPQVEVDLWGNALRGFVAGRGEVTVAHAPADGRAAATRIVPLEIDGRFEAEVYDRSGQPTMFAPGDAVTLTPSDGEPFVLTVPRVTAVVAEGGALVLGQAPPGAALRTTVFADEPDYFAVRPVASPSITLEGRAAADGRYALRCAGAGCPARYGRLVADTGRVRAVLRWVDRPLSGIGVTQSNAFGRATGGTAVDIAFASGAHSGAHRSAVAQPSQLDRLPYWEIDWADLHPDGIPLGTQLRLGIGDETTDVTVAPVTWQADVLADRVTGSAPPLHAVVVLVQPADPDRGAASATVLSGIDGRFAADLPGFNLRAGDRLYLYVIRPGAAYFLQYVDPGVQGPEEPMPVASATPGPTLTRQAPPMPTLGMPTPARPTAPPASPADGRTLYLPTAWR